MEQGNEILLFATILAPMITAFFQLAKQVTEGIPKRYIPLMALIIGIAVGALGQPFTDMELVSRLWAGALGGLGATGLFEMVKTKKEGQ